MKLFIERPSEQRTQSERSYFAFWVRIILGPGLWLSVAGWKYFPDEQKVSTPAQAKGPGRGFVTTTKMSTEVYNKVLEKARQVFNEDDPAQGSG